MAARKEPELTPYRYLQQCMMGFGSLVRTAEEGKLE